MLCSNSYLIQIRQPYMLQKQSVDFNDSCPVICKKCSELLFSTDSVDALLKYVKENKQKNYFILHQNQTSNFVLPENFQIHKEEPFYKVCVFRIQCKKCHNKVGYEIKSVNEELQKLKMLDRFVVEFDQIAPVDNEVDFSERILDLFNQNFGQSEDEEEQTNSLKQKKTLTKEEQQKPSQIKKIGLRSIQQKMKNIRSQIEKEAIGKEVIEEIILSYDFLFNVLENIQERVEQAFSICKGMKKKYGNDWRTHS